MGIMGGSIRRDVAVRNWGWVGGDSNCSCGEQWAGPVLLIVAGTALWELGWMSWGAMCSMDREG